MSKKDIPYVSKQSKALNITYSNNSNNYNISTPTWWIMIGKNIKILRENKNGNKKQSVGI